jgi:hypothetical protein
MSVLPLSKSNCELLHYFGDLGQFHIWGALPFDFNQSGVVHKLIPNLLKRMYGYCWASSRRSPLNITSKHPDYATARHELWKATPLFDYTCLLTGRSVGRILDTLCMTFRPPPHKAGSLLVCIKVYDWGQRNCATRKKAIHQHELLEYASH